MVSNVENMLAKHEVLLNQLIEQARENRETTKAIQGMTIEVRNLSISVENNIAKTTKSAREQGQRIGIIESEINILKSKNHEARIMALESKGAKRWESFIYGLLGAVAVVVVAIAAGQLGISI